MFHLFLAKLLLEREKVIFLRRMMVTPVIIVIYYRDENAQYLLLFIDLFLYFTSYII